MGNGGFRQFSKVLQWLATSTTGWVGSSWAFMTAALITCLWLVLGPIFHYTDTWQLVMNTISSIVTFLMVFLIQATQNRDAKAIHLKLDELIRSSRARNVFADLEDASEAELAAFKDEFRKLRQRHTAPGEAAEKAHRMVHKPGSH